MAREYRWSGSVSGFASLAALLLLPPITAAGQETREGGEFQVNTYTTHNQFLASVAADAGGDFLVAWQSSNQDGSGIGVFAQRFASPAILDIDADGEVGP